MGDERLGNPPQGNKEPLVVKTMLEDPRNAIISDTVGWATEGHPACKKGGCWFVGSNNLTVALHVLELWLSPPPLSSLLQFNLDWRHSGSGLLRLFWKMAVKQALLLLVLTSETALLACLFHRLQ